MALLKVRPDALNLLRLAQTNSASIVTARTRSLTSAAQDEERNWIAMTIGSVMLAIALLWLTSRWITRPLRALADQATAMAGQRLPTAVQEILETPVNEEIVQPEVEPVRVHAGGEVNDVEVALNKVQDSAVSLAVEQATLRRSVADAYVNLGRRNQNLLSRQLEFITQLENDESDPETLEHLFRLDHLATRMRRNAESLLVLAGLAPPRTWSAPVAMGDVVRGALGEVEGYRRVRLRHVDDARVDGAAAADVSHVVAELVENALSFSPPDADVEVYGRRDDHGYVITIVDSGIGMHEDDLERANALISSANAVTLAPSRFLGHYVVAQLAARHGLTVQLAASPAGGLTAMVALPSALLGLAPVQPNERPAEVAAPVVPPSAEPERPVTALPRRESGAETPPTTGRGSAAPISFRGAAAPPPELQLVAPIDDEDDDVIDVAYDPDPVDALSARDGDDIAVGAPEPEPEPEAVPSADETPTTPEPPAPARPARPRLGLGSFADLRGAKVQPAPAEAADEAPADGPSPSLPAPAVASGVDPDRPAPLAPDRRASFAEVAEAVDVAAGRPAESNSGSPFSEDLIPQRLPKRGRRNSKLETPWVRQRPVVERAARRSSHGRRRGAAIARRDSQRCDCRAAPVAARLPRLPPQLRPRLRRTALTSPSPTRPRRRPPPAASGSRSSPPSVPRPNRLVRKLASMIGEGIDGAIRRSECHERQRRRPELQLVAFELRRRDAGRDRRGRGVVRRPAHGDVELTRTRRCRAAVGDHRRYDELGREHGSLFRAG